MTRNHRWTLVVAMALIGLLVTAPARAWADPASNDNTPIARTYVCTQQTHDDETVSDDAWSSYPQEREQADQQDEQPLHGLRIALADDTKGISYRVRGVDEAWGDEWASDGEESTSTQAIVALQAKLSDELSKRFDVRYRVRTVAQGWLDWATNGEDAGNDGEAITDVQVTLVPKDADALTDQTTDNEADEPAAAESAGDEQEAPLTPAASEPGITYQTHVENDGWQNWRSNGTMSGTSGRSLRLEGIKIHLDNVSGDVRYQVHVQNDGWQNEVGTNQLAGTTGRSLRLEGIKIRLTGAVANTHDVWYRVHVQNDGWQGWVKNGQMAGTEGRSLRLEGIEILLIQKGGALPTGPGSTYTPTPSSSATPAVYYQGHVQNIGWQDEKSNGEIAGTSGQSLRVEAMRVAVRGINGGIRYKVHVQNEGWHDWVSDGLVAGTQGKSYRLEALQVELTGADKDNYDIYYRSHVQNIGWLTWAKNGEKSGSSGQSYRMEAVQVRIQARGTTAPANDNAAMAVPFYDGSQPSSVSPTTNNTGLNGVDLSSWNGDMDLSQLDAQFVIIKATQGTGYVNPYFQNHTSDAFKNNMLVGFYHYAVGADPIAEADYFYDHIKQYKGKAIACLDWESIQNSKFDTGVDVTWCKQFLERIQSRFGGTPFLYTSKNYTNKYDWSPVAAKFPLWGAQYASNDPVEGYQSDPWQSSAKWGAWGTRPTIFQYSGNGVLEHNGGSAINFDLDLFYGSASDWARYVG